MGVLLVVSLEAAQVQVPHPYPLHHPAWEEVQVAQMLPSLAQHQVCPLGPCPEVPQADQQLMVLP